MMYQSKPSAGSATVSAHKLFSAARLKLAALSMIVVIAIVAAFSVYIYYNVTSDIADIGRQVTTVDGDFQQQVVDHTTASVVRSLAYADAAVLLLAAFLSFYFADRVLRPIRAATEAQRAFAANASHELRTPLAILKSDTETLARATSPNAQLVHEIAVSNLEEVERMERLVGNLLALARSEHGMAEATPVDLSGLARHLVGNMQGLAKTAGVTLSLDGELQSMVSVAPDTERALSNIIQNALDHTGAGGTIAVHLETVEDGALVKITDSGAGIAPHDLPHVFDRFYKGVAGRGTGLGLSLVQEIVERQGGSIALESTVGTGTTAILRFPHTMGVS